MPINKDFILLSNVNFNIYILSPIEIERGASSSNTVSAGFQILGKTKKIPISVQFGGHPGLISCHI
jgi:hypothetical protein